MNNYYCLICEKEEQLCSCDKSNLYCNHCNLYYSDCYCIGIDDEMLNSHTPIKKTKKEYNSSKAIPIVPPSISNKINFGQFYTPLYNIDSLINSSMTENPAITPKLNMPQKMEGVSLEKHYLNVQPKKKKKKKHKNI